MSALRHVLFSTVCLAAFGNGFLSAAEPEHYLSQVKPLLKSRCYACHGALKQEGGLRLDTATLIRTGGDSGNPLAEGDDPSRSLLLERVSSKDVAYRMPPEHEGEPFTPQEIEILQKWLAQGAPGPEDEAPEADPAEHWAFKPIVRPPVPQHDGKTASRHPIDLFLAQHHSEHGLIPQAEASRALLLRRLYLDLIGVLPDEQEISDFENDSSPDWYEKVVDRLLNDPRHGERWARHWMDIWRYSDWWGLGDQIRNSSPHMWHFRDWIVESLNSDTSYDRMIQLMLAADEIAPEDPDKLRATGYLVRNYYIFNRNQWMGETVEHVSKGLLGLSMNCAKCHDHKYDPIDQTAYYQMRAFFEPYQVRLDMVPGEMNLQKDAIPRVFDALLDTPTFRFIRGEESRPDQSHPIAPGIPEIVSFGELNIETVKLPRSAWEPGLHVWVQQNYLSAAKEKLKASQQKYEQALAKVRRDESTPSTPPTQHPQYSPVEDNFATLDTERWRVNGAGWVQQSGKLEQKTDGPTHSSLTFLGTVPQEFEATLKFQLQGGSRWRSVGISFDVAPPEENSAENSAETRQLVYLSGAAEDSKVQGAYAKSGAWTYPREGRQPFKVEIGREYTLQVRVRGNLVNASVNGEHILSWKTPLPRRSGGTVQLTTFDALATFHEFRLTALDASVPLIEPGEALVPATPQEVLEVAEAELRVAQLELQEVEHRIAAMLAQSNDVTASDSRHLAIRSERELAAAKARLEVIGHQQKLQRLSSASKNEDEIQKTTKNLDDAKKKLKEATERFEKEITDEDKFTPLPGAAWTTTRFQNTTRDDPPVSFPQVSTGRRTALAKWITDRRNPLTARVAVNHIWNRHLGEPLAPVPFDIGRNSPNPALPELIDWLASEFMENGWSMKHLHRLIVTSAAYRMGSSIAGVESNLKSDPDNRYLWRRVPVRLEAEVIRDSILSLAGTLDPTVGGPSVPPDAQDNSKRRSLYFYHSNNDRNLFLTTFDEAEVSECYRREQSIVPQQALALSNSKLILDSSVEIADRLSRTAVNDRDFIQSAFRNILGSFPNEEEMKLALQGLDELKALPDISPEQTRAHFIWILLNHNDFVTLR